jgi:hypothetical protein
MTRNDFMDFFRDDEKLNTLSNDDRLEIFVSIVGGQSDFTVDLFNEILDNYDVDWIYVNEVAPARFLERRRQLSAKEGFDFENFTKEDADELRELEITISDMYEDYGDGLFYEFINELDKIGGLSVFRKCFVTDEDAKIREELANSILQKLKQRRIDDPERYY